MGLFVIKSSCGAVLSSSHVVELFCQEDLVELFVKLMSVCLFLCFYKKLCVTSGERVTQAKAERTFMRSLLYYY